MTRFVQSTLVRRAEEALILRCADAGFPALKGNFKYSQHKLMMLQEAHPDMVIRHKRIFQASLNMVSCGSSTTNSFVHRTCLHGVKLVIRSNGWEEELGSLSPDDRQWVKDNSVYVQVSIPLWVH